MQEERNYIMRNVYPELKQACCSFGVQFDIIDMRYDKVKNDQEFANLMIKEIELCQQLSSRPNFVVSEYLILGKDLIIHYIEPEICIHSHLNFMFKRGTMLFLSTVQWHV